MCSIAKAVLLIAAILVLAGAICVSTCRFESLPEKLAERLGFVASVATLIGLCYTAIQIWQTKALARATKDAADKAILELRANDYQFALLVANRLLGEIRAHKLNRMWKMAALRLHDLADQCLHLACIRPGVDDQWREFVRVVNYWGSEFDRGQNGRHLAFDQEQWRSLDETLGEKLSRESQPFASNGNEE